MRPFRTIPTKSAFFLETPVIVWIMSAVIAVSYQYENWPSTNMLEYSWVCLFKNMAAAIINFQRVVKRSLLVLPGISTWRPTVMPYPVLCRTSPILPLTRVSNAASMFVLWQFRAAFLSLSPEALREFQRRWSHRNCWANSVCNCTHPFLEPFS